MSTHQDEESVVAGEPTAEEAEELAWSAEVRRNELKALAESSRLLVTISSALLAGSAVFLSQTPSVPVFRVLAACLLLACLGFALVGTMPYAANIDWNCPEDVRKAREQAASYKALLLWCSAGCLFVAFTCLLLGMLLA